MLRLAIIGSGWAGARQTEAAGELGSKIEVVALVDNDADFLRGQAQKLNIAKTFTDYRDALADGHIDAVSICLPHALHCPVALEAAAAGKHILCEKPLALTVAEATQMIEAAQAGDVKLYVAESEVYTSRSKTLRRLVQSGALIGPLVSASVTHGFRAPEYGYPGRRAWLAEPKLGGTGTWMLHGIHSMANCAMSWAKWKRSTCKTTRAALLNGTMSKAPSVAFSPSKAVSTSRVVQSCEFKLYDKLATHLLHGERGSIRATKNGYCCFTDKAVSDFVPYPDESLSAYAQELEAFADYVAGTAQGPTTATAERRSLAIVQAGYESLESGQPIHLKTRFGPL